MTVNKKKTNKPISGKLLKIVVKENGKVLMELKPTKTNEVKANRMSYMANIEIIRVYEQ